MQQITTNPPGPTTTIGASGFDAHPDAVEAWIAGLPLANVGETRRLLFNALAALNAKELTNQQRFKILEMFRGPVHYLGDALKRQLLGASFPLSFNANNVASLLQSLQLEIAQGYQHIVDDLLTADNFRQDFVLLTTAMQRAMYYLGQSLLTGYQVYRPAATGLWSKIHCLYDAAERKGLLSSIVKDHFRRRDQETTIEAQYKQILLLALADPNHLTQTDMALVYALLEKWAPACRLTVNSPAIEPSAACVVDVSSDAPPRYVMHGAIPHSATCRLLNMGELVLALRALLPKDASQLPEQAAPASWKTLIQRLIGVWGKTAKRRFSRSAGTTQSATIVFGLGACHQLISKETPSAQGEIVIFGHHLSPSPRKPAASPGVSTVNGVVTYPSAVVNESAGGARLKWMHPDLNKMRVGEIVAIRHDHQADQPWGIAAIRWIKTLSDRSVEYGIQLLVPDATPVKIRHYSEHEPAPDFLKCLFLPELKATRQPASLVVPAPLYHAADIITLKIDESEHHLRLTKAMENTSTFSRFRFTTVNVNSLLESSEQQSHPRPSDAHGAAQ